MPVCVLINSVLATEKFLLINNMTGAHDGRGHTMEGGTRWKGAHEIEISKKKQKILWLLKREGPHFQPKNFCQLL